MAPHINVAAASLVCILLILSPLSEGKRTLGGGGRKTGGGGHTTRRQPETSVTKPTYNTNSGNSHADQAKLSYPNYNSQPNRPASAPAPNTNSQPIGWNVPNNQQSHGGPPPSYSATNVAGGAKTNVHEPPPVYQKPNYGAPPPNYAQATGTHYGGSSYPGQGQLPQGATYHNPNSLPPGATMYNSPSHVPGGGYPMGGGSYPMGGGGGYPMSGGYHAPGGYYPPNSVPAGATFVPAGAAIPPGAVMYSSPPQQTSSGLGFGSGLAAGAIGGAILGHVLTPSGTKVVEQAPAAGNAAGGGDRIIIINNSGEPVNATDVNGATVINTGAPTAAPAAGGDTPAQLAPMAPMAPMTPGMNETTPMPDGSPAAAAAPPVPANPEQPAPGGLICVPVRVNETDPTDATKMIEVEKIACYPAPPPPPAAAPEAMDANNPAAPPPAEGSAPLAPIQPVGGSQQLQQSTLMGDQSVKEASSGASTNQAVMALLVGFLARYMLAY